MIACPSKTYRVIRVLCYARFSHYSQSGHRLILADAKMEYLDLQILEAAVLGEVQQRRWPQSAHNSELVQQASVKDVRSRSANGQLLAGGALRGPQSPEPLRFTTPYLRKQHPDMVTSGTGA